MLVTEMNAQALPEESSVLGACVGNRENSIYLVIYNAFVGEIK